ncbi:hypothetical protein [Simiduia aestuariiviva]|uniref:Uncharacterized protein n=1 Tax=Simiduia aestuariiviva TaxID=1510459 RepID=A0A839UHM0_9GAMM|nr:hypothetical protein [Simiduia aestuariiviva]MBB3166963.1 hypothetical protein [Simiduia aestuariiviva]
MIELLVAANEEERQEFFSWMDWREYDSEVARLFIAQLEALAGDAPLMQCVENEEGMSIVYEGKAHRIPLTDTGSDRYVTLCSLAKLVQDSHDVWLHRETLGDDTHGFLVLNKAQSAELAEKYGEWSAQHLKKLAPGWCEIYQRRIPYLGNEDYAVAFARAVAAEEAEERARVDNYHAAREAQIQANHRADRKQRRKQRLEWVIAVVFLVAIAVMYVKKEIDAANEPSCRVLIDGVCKFYNETKP